MSLRTWIYSALRDDPVVGGIVGNRIFQGESMLTAQVTKPFVVYRIGNETDENLAEEDVNPRRVFWQIYVHDEGSDYQNLDDLVKAIKDVFRVNGVSPSNLVMSTRYLETSRDLDDLTMQTIFRYIRFQSILSG